MELNFSKFVSVIEPGICADELDRRFASYSPSGMEAVRERREMLTPTRHCSSLNPVVYAARTIKLQAQLANERLGLEQACYSLYKKVAVLDTPLVLGSSNIREEGDLLRNFGRLTHEDPSVRGGILSTKMWTPTLNDSLILGAYLHGKPCFISLPSGYPRSKDVCTPEGPRVFLREIAMLTALGFEQVIDPDHVETVGLLYQLPASRDPSFEELTSEQFYERAQAAYTIMQEAAATCKTVEAAKGVFKDGWGSRPASPATPAVIRPPSSTSWTKSPYALLPVIPSPFTSASVSVSPCIGFSPPPITLPTMGGVPVSSAQRPKARRTRPPVGKYVPKKPSV